MMHPPKVEMKHVVCLVAALESGSFRKAAKSLGLEQSVVSRRVRETEERLSRTLFRRTPSGVTPHDDAAHFIRQLKRAYTLVQSAERTLLLNPNSPVEVRLGSYLPICTKNVQQLANSIRRDLPNIDFRFLECELHQVMDGLECGQFDIAICPRPAQNIEADWTLLWYERPVALMRRSDPLVSRTWISKNDLHLRTVLVSSLARDAFIKDMLENCDSEVCRSIEVDLQEVSHQSIPTLVSSTGQIAISLESFEPAFGKETVIRLLACDPIPVGAYANSTLRGSVVSRLVEYFQRVNHSSPESAIVRTCQDT